MMRISLEQASYELKEGRVVAVPTETVYGLAASLSHPQAIQRIFDLKNRPPNNPLIIHISTANQIDTYASELPPHFDTLARSFWPGPMTLIIPIQPDLIHESVRANLKTAGFRIPQHSLAKKLIDLTGPLVMPSANLSGRPSSTSPEHVESDFGVEFPVLDGGTCRKGLESTILGWIDDKWVIFRSGALSPVEFESVLGYEPIIMTHIKGKDPVCPGQLFRHYSPRAKLLLSDAMHIDAAQIENASCILGFKERSYPHNKLIFILGSLNNAEEVAHNLYHVLRQLDEENMPSAWVDMNFPSDGLWITIAERLNRAGQAP